MNRSMPASFTADVRALMMLETRSSVEFVRGLDWDVTNTTPEQALAVESKAPSTVMSVTMLEW